MVLYKKKLFYHNVRVFVVVNIDENQFLVLNSNFKHNRIISEITILKNKRKLIKHNNITFGCQQ